jgi:two-component system CitB family sensor kinase
VLKRLSIARQFLVLQVCIMLVVVTAVAGISIAQANTSFRDTEGRRLLSVAETVAANESVRLGLVDPSAEDSLAGIAETARGVSGASTVVIADRFAILRTGPDANGKLDIGASTVLAGRAWVGKVGAQLLAHAPVLGTDGRPVGFVSAGRRYPTPAEQLATALPNLVAYLVLGGVLGLAGSLLLARRVNRQTLGLDASEIVGLAEHREAMLHGIREGVIALDVQGRITLANDEATRLLGLPARAVGVTIDSLGLSRKLRSVLIGRSPGTDLVLLHGDRVLVLNNTRISLRGTALGSVTTLRDRTEMVAMEHELDVTRHTTDALHSQARIFATRLGAISDLIAVGRPDDARQLAGHASQEFDRISNDIAGHVADPAVAALLVSKASLAAADGIAMHLARGSTLPPLDEPMSVDVVAVLAAMVDHALAGLNRLPGQAWLEVAVLAGIGGVHLIIRDSGQVALADPHGQRRTNGNGSDPVALDPLEKARIICTRRGGIVGWEEGGQLVLEAWLPTGPGRH